MTVRWLALALCLGLTGVASAQDVLAPAQAVAFADDLKDPASVIGTPQPAGHCEPAPCPSACEQLCAPPGRAWVSAEYLYGITSGGVLPSLAVTTPVPFGAGGSTLIGGGRVNNDFRSGLRVTAGVWCNPARTFGLEEDFFFLGRSRDRAVTDAGELVGRPFVNALTGTPATAPVSFPGLVAGTLTATSSTETFGGGFNFLRNRSATATGRLDWLVGFRYLNLRDDLGVTVNAAAGPALGVLAGGADVIVTDRFHTASNFYGGTVGAKFERQSGRFFVAGRAAVALGVSHQDVRVDGSTTITPPVGLPTVQAGGLLAQSSNSGRFTNDEFAVVPEFNLRLGSQVTSRARMYVGYNLTYWSNVVRAGDQIDLRVNPTLVPPLAIGGVGPALPAFRFTTTDFWLQGVSVGGEVRY